jgi:hypothetical protein
MTECMTKPYMVSLSVLLMLLVSNVAKPQQPTKRVAVVRNDANASVTIEFRASDKWQQVELKAGMDTDLTCDRIRVSTTRSDNAVITVEMPVQLGKKYRLAWNDTASMWDFTAAL